MKIMICGSMTFAKEMMQVKKELENLGHLVLIPPDTVAHINDPTLIDNLDSDYKHAVETDVLRESFDLLAQSDAMLILNYPKNNTPGYIGTSSLMEIGIAYYLGKKIFLLNKIPEPQRARWAHEVCIMQPKIIDGDLNKINE